MTEAKIPTVSDLRRELSELISAIKEDNDGYGRDHLLSGRWPMVHNLAALIAAKAAKETQ